MTNSSRAARIGAVALRVVLGAVFVYSAWLKLKAPWQLFAGDIADYRILPEWAVIPLARSLPWVELALGALLIVGRLVRTAAAGLTLLMAVFLSLMVRAMVLHMDINCGCFGTGERISWHTLARDGALLAACLGLCWTAFARRRKAA